MHQNQNKHIPVLGAEVLHYLDPKEGDSYLDLTAGYGGHAASVLDKTKPRLPTQAVLVDRDGEAIEALRQRFAKQPVEYRHGDFLAVSRQLASADWKFDLVLADLGVSSPHLDSTHRGFSFMADAPLDMRMDTRQTLTAADIVNTYSEADLTQLIRWYGEEPKAATIARRIVASRPVRTTGQLTTIIAGSATKPRQAGGKHPATKTFQALRIAVNDELTQLELALPLWLDNLLAPGGRIVVISFHSLEDRLVKRALQARAGGGYDAELRMLTKRPVTASTTEIAHNPRARSAKLRAAVKIKT